MWQELWNFAGLAVDGVAIFLLLVFCTATVDDYEKSRHSIPGDRWVPTIITMLFAGSILWLIHRY